MAPEQARGLPIDARADIFSLGVMLQEMLAGSAVSGELERIVTKTLRPRPEERYQGIQDLLLDLKLSGRGWTRRDGRRPARRLWPILAAAAGIAVAALAWFSYVGRRPALTATDTILLADFVNTTGEPVFDGTLKQALAVQLRQTPFLNLFPEEAVREALRLMERSPDGAGDARRRARECQRERLKALLAGTIAPLGRLYVITLEAVNAQTGEVIASQQIEAESRSVCCGRSARPRPSCAGSWANRWRRCRSTTRADRACDVRVPRRAESVLRRSRTVHARQHVRPYHCSTGQ